MLMQSSESDPDSSQAKSAEELDGRLKVNVFQRSFAVLEYVVRAGHSVAPSDIAEHLSLPKPTVYRMIESFEANGFLRRQFASRRISIGPRLADFGFDVVRASIQYAPRRSILNALVCEVGETCNVGTLEGNEIVYLDRVEAKHWPLRLNFHIGSRVPLHCTAIGKLFLAFLPVNQREKLLAAIEMTALTPHTITDRAVLEAELQTVIADGLSVDSEEYTIGVVCVAAPIFNKKGEIQAGVAIQAPSARMTVKDAQLHRAALQEAAKQIGASFMLK
jgi:IclR family acetate operon transcriptional repressor